MLLANYLSFRKLCHIVTGQNISATKCKTRILNKEGPMNNCLNKVIDLNKAKQTRH